ncbi:hypothetical protein HGRIS_004306 [Hohenbuehelia grisea]|uniref:Uncharacterized protein n=1 Tax=Hohenbuehelia grisea TaxID=104357 RepID=A0ABR3IPD9_9AGAR
MDPQHSWFEASLLAPVTLQSHRSTIQEPILPAEGVQGLSSYHPASSPPQTFSTPSELLRGMAAQDADAYAAAIANVRKPESTRKAHRRAMAESIGYTPIDPDSISSHEKKRNYLECLEHYVTYLHEQIGLVGSTPAALERVLAPGHVLSSRSIRTLLVHTKDSARKLYAQMLQEEQTFINLRHRAWIELGIEVEGDVSGYPIVADSGGLCPDVASPHSMHSASDGSSMHTPGDEVALFGTTDIPRAITVPVNPMASYATLMDSEPALQAGACGPCTQL